MERYNFKAIEEKWQSHWEKEKTFSTKIDKKKESLETNSVDGHNIPSRHYGIIMNMDDWKTLAVDLQNKKIQFIIEPNIRFKDEKGEQATLLPFYYSGAATKSRTRDLLITNQLLYHG